MGKWVISKPYPNRLHLIMGKWVRIFYGPKKPSKKSYLWWQNIKPLQILGKMWNICDQQEKLSQLCVIAVTNTNILERNFPSILFARDN